MSEHDPDGPNYREYSEVELRQARASIDELQYPDRAAILEAELRRRSAQAAASRRAEPPAGPLPASAPSPDGSAPRPKQPAWPTVTGVITIILGLIGILGALSTALVPLILPAMRQLLLGHEDALRESGAEIDKLRTLLELPGWYPLVAVPLGLAALVVYVAYTLGAFRLLGRQERGLKLLVRSLKGSIILRLLWVVTGVAAWGTQLLFVRAGFTIVGLLADGVLLYVFSKADRGVLK